MGTVPLPVPDVITSAYLVAGPLALADPTAVLREALSGAMPSLPMRVAELALDNDLLSVDVVAARDVAPPPPLLELMGADAEALAALADAEQALLVRAHGPPHPLAPHEIAARWAVAQLATVADAAAVVDLYTPRFVAIGDLVRHPDGEDPVPLADLVVVAMSPGDRGHWVSTRGLARYGLPELQVRDVPPPITPMWGRLLTGLGRTMVDAFTEAVRRPSEPPSFVEVDDHPVLSVDAVAAAYGMPSPDVGGQAVVRVRLDPAPDPDADSFLTVTAPDDHTRSAGEFLVATAEAVTGVEAESSIGHVAGDDEGMAAAVETARSSLPVARARFLAGELSQQRLLMVKWALTTEVGVEFPWFFVTAWSDPDRMEGTAAVDAEHDPDVAVGRPVAVAVDDVADWGVYVEGEGLVEGGWTNAYLQGEPPPPVPDGPPPPPAADPPPGTRRWFRGRGPG